MKNSKILQSLESNEIEWNSFKKQSAKKSIGKISFESTTENSFNSDPINDSSADFDSFDEKIMGLSMEKSVITCNSIILIDEDKITFNDHQFFIDTTLEEESSFKIYNVHDENNQEFTLKQIYYQTSSQLCDCITLYNMLKDDNHICTIYYFDISYEKRCVTIVFEKVKLISTRSIDENTTKKSIKQILEVINSISALNLKFDMISVKDFVDTKNGIKLLCFEQLSIPHCQVFRIPAIGQQLKSNEFSLNLFNLLNQFNITNDLFLSTLKTSKIEDIPQILTNHYFDEEKEEEIKETKDSNDSQISFESNESQFPSGTSDFQSSEEDCNSQTLDEEIDLQNEDDIASPVDNIINLISQEMTPRERKNAFKEEHVCDQNQETKNYFNLSQIDFSFCIGILLMLTISLVLKGIHESNFGFGNACEVFFGLRLFWILLICELFYIVFRMKSQKHKKYISKKIYQYIIILAVILFLLNASLVFHLFITRINLYVPSFTLLVTLCWILLSLSLLNE